MEKIQIVAEYVAFDKSSSFFPVPKKMGNFQKMGNSHKNGKIPIKIGKFL